METFHTSRLLAVSNAGFIISLIASLTPPTFLSRSISKGNMRVESSPRTQQFSRSRVGAVLALSEHITVQRVGIYHLSVGNIVVPLERTMFPHSDDNSLSRWDSSRRILSTSQVSQLKNTVLLLSLLQLHFLTADISTSAVSRIILEFGARFGCYTSTQNQAGGS